MVKIITYRDSAADEAYLSMVYPLRARPAEVSDARNWEESCRAEGERVAQFLADHLPWEVLNEVCHNLILLRETA